MKRARLVALAAVVAVSVTTLAVAAPDPKTPPPPPPPVPELPIPPPAEGQTDPPLNDKVPVAAGSGSGMPTAGSAAPAAGSDRGSDQTPDRDVHDNTAEDAAGAPLPGAESGRIDVVDPGDSPLRVAGRVVLFVPKVVYEALFVPVHGVFYALDRYHFDQLYYRIFFNGNHTIGFIPTATYEAGFGASIGLRFQMTDVFGAKERFAVQGTTGAVLGDPYRESGLVELHTGQRLGKHFELGLVSNFDRRPADAFWGIGNGEDTTKIPATPIDPHTDSTAVEVYHRYQESRVALTADIQPTPDVHLAFTGALTELRFDQSTQGTPLGQVYNPADLPGFLGGVQHAYGELELRWDTRHRGTMWEPFKLYSGGSLVSAYAGRVDRLDGGVDFWRYGGELQHFFRLARGPRILITRVRAQGVSGGRADVPFTELPYLGGGDILRGYSYERFRDRASLMGSIQYSWDLSSRVNAYLFTDIGRVYESFDDLSAHGLRVSYGVGLDLHGDSGLVATGYIASTTDGGFLFNLAFNPITDARQRWR